jgi:hypothetical protein
MAIKKRKYKKKYKKKYKGTRYIAKVLQKYGGKKYKKYSDAIAKARTVFSDLQSKGEKVRVANILGITRVHRAPKEAPKLLGTLQSPQPYFFLVDYPVDIFRTSSQVTFISELFNEGVTEVQGGEKPSYRKHFSGFVNFLNKQIKDRENAYDYRVMCTPLQYDRKNKRWITKIVAIDPEGEETTFNYEPSPSLEQEIVAPPPKKEAKPVKPTKSDEERIKELDLKILKEKSRQQATELLLKGIFTKKEFKDEIDRINKL